MKLLKTLRVIACLPLLALAACSSGSNSGEGAATPPASGSSYKPLSQRMNDNNPTRDKDGNWSNSKRSSFETNRESTYFKGDYAKKDFKTKDYAKKSWWGDTKYESKKFEGDTDGSRFQTSSKFQGQGARESKTAADLQDNYKTGTYGTNAARESTSARIDKTSDAETDFRRKVFGTPSVVDWREQREMSRGEVKGILGR